jgi:hypothetical protein
VAQRGAEATASVPARKHAALAEGLSASELEQVEMTCSWTPHNLRRAMTHFHPTKAEYQFIFSIWQKFDEKLARIHAAGDHAPRDLHTSSPASS